MGRLYKSLLYYYPKKLWKGDREISRSWIQLKEKSVRTTTDISHVSPFLKPNHSFLKNIGCLSPNINLANSKTAAVRRTFKAKKSHLLDKENSIFQGFQNSTFQVCPNEWNGHTIEPCCIGRAFQINTSRDVKE